MRKKKREKQRQARMVHKHVDQYPEALLFREAPWNYRKTTHEHTQKG